MTDERRLFEKLCLEGFQAGLSWITILNKREAFRAALAQFEAEPLADFGAAEVDQLMGNAGIVRHRGKIESAINNARRVLELRREFGSLAHYVWRYAPLAAQQRPERMTLPAVRAMTTSAASVALSKEGLQAKPGQKGRSAALVGALARVFLAARGHAALQAHALAAAVRGHCHAGHGGGTGCALAVGFGDDFVAHDGS